MPPRGLLILAIPETMLWAGGTPDSATYATTFAGGVMFYVPALPLISVPSRLPIPVRAIGVIAALPWAVHAYRYLTGESPAADSGVVIAGYILLSLTVLGAIVDLLRAQEDA